MDDLDPTDDSGASRPKTTLSPEQPPAALQGWKAQQKQAFERVVKQALAAKVYSFPPEDDTFYLSCLPQRSQKVKKPDQREAEVKNIKNYCELGNGKDYPEGFKEQIQKRLQWELNHLQNTQRDPDPTPKDEGPTKSGKVLEPPFIPLDGIKVKRVEGEVKPLFDRANQHKEPTQLPPPDPPTGRTYGAPYIGNFGLAGTVEKKQIFSVSGRCMWSAFFNANIVLIRQGYSESVASMVSHESPIDFCRFVSSAIHMQLTQKLDYTLTSRSVITTFNENWGEDLIKEQEGKKVISADACGAPFHLVANCLNLYSAYRVMFCSGCMRWSKQLLSIVSGIEATSLLRNGQLHTHKVDYCNKKAMWHCKGPMWTQVRLNPHGFWLKPEKRRMMLIKDIMHSKNFRRQLDVYGNIYDCRAVAFVYEVKLSEEEKKKIPASRWLFGLQPSKAYHAVLVILPEKRDRDAIFVVDSNDYSDGRARTEAPFRADNHGKELEGVIDALWYVKSKTD